MSEDSRKSQSNPERKRIGELLVEARIVEPGHVEEALEVQRNGGGKTVAILIRLGHLDTDTFGQFLARLPGVASIDLSQYEVPEETHGVIPRDFAEEHEVFPIDKLGKHLTVGMVFPLDEDTLKKLEEITGLRVKPLLCSAANIRAAIERYYAKPATLAAEGTGALRAYGIAARQISTSMRLENIVGLIKQINVPPALPQTVGKVQEALDNPEIALDDVANVISLDPMVSANLLKLVNSSAYTFTNPIDDVGAAVKLMGLNEVYAAVLSSSVGGIIGKSELFDYKTFWRQAVFSAAAVRAIAAAARETVKAASISACLIHEMGRFALSEAAPGQYLKLDSALAGGELLAAEEAEFGIAHPEAGYVLADHWRLPPDIAEVIRFHHAPERVSARPVDAAMVALASHMAEIFGQDTEVGTQDFEPCSELLSAIGLDAAYALEIFDEVRTQVKEATA